jgi:hypothetical protein
MPEEVKEYSISITHEDILDATMVFRRERRKRKRMVGFALSYRAKIEGRWQEVIRYDTTHGYLHVQRFWRSSKPIPLKEEEWMPLDYLFKEYKRDIVENWERYRSLVERKLRR